jgi:hypothetical protein
LPEFLKIDLVAATRDDRDTRRQQAVLAAVKPLLDLIGEPFGKRVETLGSDFGVLLSDKSGDDRA